MASVDIYQMTTKDTNHKVAPVTIFDAVVNPLNKKTLDQEFEDMVGAKDESVAVDDADATLVTTALRKTEQVLTQAEKKQVRTNINAADADDLIQLSETVSENKTNTDAKLSELGSEVESGHLVFISSTDEKRIKYHYNIIRNSSYQLLLNKSKWATDSLEEGRVILGVFVKYRYEDAETQVVGQYKDTEGHLIYDFTIANKEVEYLRVAMNGDVGTELRYVLERVEYAKEIKKELDSEIKEIKEKSSSIFAKDEIGLSKYINNIQYKGPIYENLVKKPDGTLRKYAIHHISKSEGKFVIYRENDEGTLVPYINQTKTDWLNTNIIELSGAEGAKWIISFNSIPSGEIDLGYYTFSDKNVISPSVFTDYEDIYNLKGETALLNDVVGISQESYSLTDREWVIGSYGVEEGLITINEGSGTRVGLKDAIFLYKGDKCSVNSIPTNYAYWGENGDTYDKSKSYNGWSILDYSIPFSGYWRIIRRFDDNSVIKGRENELIDTIKINGLKSNISDLPNIRERVRILEENTFTEFLPNDSILNSESVIKDNVSVGLWSLRTPGIDSISKTDDHIDVTISEGSSNGGLWIVNNEIIKKNVGKKAIVRFSYKSEKELNFTMNMPIGTPGTTFVPSDDWMEVEREFEIGVQWNDYRVFFWSAVPQTFSLKNVSIKLSSDTLFKTEIDVLKDSQKRTDEEVEILKSKDDVVTDLNLTMPNLKYKIAANEYYKDEGINKTSQLVIGLLGDSWTHQTWEHSKYCTPFAKYLRDKYGNAGGGFYSFSMSHLSELSGVKMGCVDSDDADDTRSSGGSSPNGTITYRDQVEGCMWVDAADATFHTGAYLTLNVKTKHNNLVIHFHGGGGVFTYTLDGSSPVSVDTSAYNGASKIEIPCEDSPHTLRIDAISGDTVIFGVDMQRLGVSGVRVHKLGNKGATSYSFYIVDESSWKQGIYNLGLDTLTIMLGTNDGPTSVNIGYYLQTIISRVREVNPYIDLCLIQPSNNLAKGDMGSQAKLQYQCAVDNNVGFINLIPLFGSVEQIREKGTFVSDGLHPTMESGRMIANYILEKLNI